MITSRSVAKRPLDTLLVPSLAAIAARFPSPRLRSRRMGPQARCLTVSNSPGAAIGGRKGKEGQRTPRDSLLRAICARCFGASDGHSRDSSGPGHNPPQQEEGATNPLDLGVSSSIACGSPVPDLLAPSLRHGPVPSAQSSLTPSADLALRPPERLETPSSGRGNLAALAEFSPPPLSSLQPSSPQPGRHHEPITAIPLSAAADGHVRLSA